MAKRTRTGSRDENEARESGAPESSEDGRQQRGSATREGAASASSSGRPAILPPAKAAADGGRVIAHEVTTAKGDVLRVVRDGGKVFVSGIGAEPIEVTSEALAIAQIDRIAAASRGEKP